MGRMGLAVLVVVVIAAGVATTAGSTAIEPGWRKAAQPRALRIARSMRVVPD